MRNRYLILLTAAVVAAGCEGTGDYRTLLNQDGELGIVNRPPTADYIADPEKLIDALRK